jgi:hypothetical protein
MVKTAAATTGAECATGAAWLLWTEQWPGRRSEQ